MFEVVYSVFLANGRPEIQKQPLEGRKMKAHSLTTALGIFLLVLVLGGCTSLNTTTNKMVFMPLVMEDSDCDANPMKDTIVCRIRTMESPSGNTVLLMSSWTDGTGKLQSVIRETLLQDGWKERFTYFPWEASLPPIVCSVFRGDGDGVDINCANSNNCEGIKKAYVSDVSWLPAVLHDQEVGKKQ